jgi:hypothetical protein
MLAMKIWTYKTQSSIYRNLIIESGGGIMDEVKIHETKADAPEINSID